VKYPFLKHRQRPAFTVVELLLAMAIIGVLLSLLVPALLNARMTARRASCRNNLVQLGIALYNYESSMKVFPPGIVNPPGPVWNEPVGYHVGWNVQLLPFVDQAPLWQQFNPQYGIYDPGNANLAGLSIPGHSCPASVNDLSGGLFATSYAGCSGGADVPLKQDNNGIFFLNSAISSTQIHDGHSNTIMVGERIAGQVPSGSDLGWSSGTSASLRNSGIPLNQPHQSLISTDEGDGIGGFGSDHEGGAMFLFADGSVVFLNNNIDPDTFSRMGNRNDGGDQPLF
jgi:prepilin-type N-terminal cleavage/methylation domain-containing protein/prepilin-type processing-associated H-X9-DG protein